MPDLIAQGAQPQQRWRRSLPPRQTLVIGRTGSWAVEWDKQVSRQHAEVCWKHGRLQIRRLDDAVNPIFLRGKATDNFFIKPGEHFVIGGTTFTLADEQVNIDANNPAPVTEQAYTAQYLQRVRFRDAEQRIDVLGRLPEIISGATSDTELFVRLVSLLMTGIPRATAVAIVVAQPDTPADGKKVRVLQWDRRDVSGEQFRPSERLILQAVNTGESIVHYWSPSKVQEGSVFTLVEDLDWAYCTPLAGEACKGWAIYVTGKFGETGQVARGSDESEEDLQDDLKFTELAAGTLSSLRQLRQLQRSHASLRQFLSPVVLEAVGDGDWEKVLAPRETEVSVLFCDLRGFSRESERYADDLMSLLTRVSRALGVTTRHILDQDGVVGDFHGDAVMGFWGWPLDQPDAAARAALTALAIRAEFEAAAHRAGHALAIFRIGIGVATGRAVAGKIGTVDQVTVTVFGPVVNLAARLEGMTKFVHAPILLDETTAARVRQTLTTGVARVRRLARVRPYGMNTALEISELLAPMSERPTLTDEHLVYFDQGVTAMIAGQWNETFELLHRVPPEDRAKDFLTGFMLRHNRTPPEKWDGVIALDQK
jgi:adenylate cyclase